MTQAWIANRTDGQYGSGTQSDPYNVAVPERFAAVLNSIPAQSEVVLLPGEYLTYGWNSDLAEQPYNRCFILKPGWRFHGCGMGNTTLKLVGIEKTPSDYNIMLAAVKGSFDFTEVSDLTLDMNFDGQDYKEAMMSACHLQGSHVKISRVRVINFGNRSGKENFLIGIGGGQIGAPVANMAIKDCVIEQPAWLDEKAAFTAIQFFGGKDGGASTYHGEVSGNYIDGQFPDGTITAHTPLEGHSFEPGRYSMQAIGVGDGWQMVYKNNRIRNLVNGIYMDTGRGKRAIVEDNLFDNVYAAIGFHYQSPEALWDHITIQNNDIALVRIKGLPANAPYGIYMGADLEKEDNLPRVKEAIVRNNRINLAGMDMDPENRTMAGIVIDHAEQAVIEGNLIRLPRSIMTTSPSGHIYLNKVSRVRAANNLRMDLGTIIAPWRADLKQWYR